MIGKRTSALRTTATETASCGAISSCFPKVSPNHKESEEVTSKLRHLPGSSSSLSSSFPLSATITSDSTPASGCATFDRHRVRTERHLGRNAFAKRQSAKRGPGTSPLGPRRCGRFPLGTRRPPPASAGGGCNRKQSVESDHRAQATVDWLWSYGPMQSSHMNENGPARLLQTQTHSALSRRVTSNGDWVPPVCAYGSVSDATHSSCELYTHKHQPCQKTHWDWDHERTY